MPYDKFKSGFVVTDNMLSGINQEAKDLKIKYNDKEFKRSKNLLKNNIKAYIARSVYGPEGMYPIFHETDAEFQQALKLFDQANKLSKGYVQLGINKFRVN
jgi:carboxyl-terminal processing protease